MADLNVYKKTIKELFQDKHTDFLVPDYQRPYAWGENECQTLWEDIFNFAFPDNNSDKFDKDNDEYFLGPIVIFKNGDKKLEIIDGQQRLTTLMLLLCAFYQKFNNMNDEDSKTARMEIEKCIWKTYELGKINMSELKINSEVATDNDKDEFINILKSGIASSESESKYAQNYKFFQRKITDLVNNYPNYFLYLPTRVLNNCILFKIEADNQDTALRIFSTLNDRGKPLSDADIFKAQFYKYYKSKSDHEKDAFIDKWKKLEEQCNKIFSASSNSSMDELFTRYMYYERAKQGISSSTTGALRKFYEKETYKLLKSEETLDNLIDLANFWNNVSIQNTESFSDRVLKQLCILNYAPNGMWTYLVSVYYLKNKENFENPDADDDEFYSFLLKTTAFVWAYAITNPGVSSLRAPMYTEMINIVNSQPVNFDKYKFDETTIRNLFDTYIFTNNRPLTKSLLVWWMFQKPEQILIPFDTNLDVEHIYSVNREKIERRLTDDSKLEKLGNKAILEKRINIRASDYRFKDKCKYYRGIVGKKEKTKNAELLDLSKTHKDFLEGDIDERNKTIIDGFIKFLRQNHLIK